MNILLIEDDLDLSEAISEFLTTQDIKCEFAYSGDEGIKMAQSSHFDVIILDVMLPYKNGFEVAKILRYQGYNTPIIMLTASDTYEDELNGFDNGVDDYVTKPCTMPLLLARIKALHRRNEPSINKLSIDTLEIYFDEHKVLREKKEIKLTPTGWKILSLLAKRSPNVVSKLEIQEYAWLNYEEVDANTFNVQLHKLRKAIDKDYETKLIHTISGVGICLKTMQAGSK